MAFDLTSHSLRRARLAARAPRLALMVACAVLSAAGLHSLLAVRTAPAPSPASGATTSRDLAAEAMAEAFARQYLSDPRQTPMRARLLQRIAPNVELDAPVVADAGRAPWTAVVADEPSRTGGRRIVVLAQVAGQMLSLVVPVRPAPGRVAISGPPAIIGAPATMTSSGLTASDPIDDPGLEATVTRAIKNFLAGRRDNLAADLDRGALVVLPDHVELD